MFLSILRFVLLVPHFGGENDRVSGHGTVLAGLLARTGSFEPSVVLGGGGRYLILALGRSKGHIAAPLARDIVRRSTGVPRTVMVPFAVLVIPGDFVLAKLLSRVPNPLFFRAGCPGKDSTF